MILLTPLIAVLAIIFYRAPGFQMAGSCAVGPNGLTIPDKFLRAGGYLYDDKPWYFEDSDFRREIWAIVSFYAFLTALLFNAEGLLLVDLHTLVFFFGIGSTCGIFVADKVMRRVPTFALNNIPIDILAYMSLSAAFGFALLSTVCSGWHLPESFWKLSESIAAFGPSLAALWLYVRRSPRDSGAVTNL